MYFTVHCCFISLLRLSLVGPENQRAVLGHACIIKWFSLGYLKTTYISMYVYTLEL